CREEERGKGVCVSICLSWWVYSELEGVLGCVTPGVPVNLRVIPPLCPAGLVLVLKHHNGAAHKLVCYFTNWAFSRPSPASILPRDLDPFLCTHLVFAFASMNNNQIVPKDPQDEKILYPEFNKLKERCVHFGCGVVFYKWKREQGAENTAVHRGVELRHIEELLLAFRKEARLTVRPRLLLSAAVSGDPRVIQKAYDVHLLGRLLDFISVLSYDLHGSWEKFTGHNSPLFSVPKDPKSSAYAMNYWRKLGAAPEKLLMGLPTYGRTFRLLKASKNELWAEAVGPASPGKYTKQAGFLAYYEICSFIWRAKKRWIDDQYVPYAYKGKEWVGYDDAVSFSYKAFFIMREHFGGAMVWTLDLDDVRGTFCGTGPFPLVYTLNNLLVKAEFSSTPPPKFWLSTAVNSSRIGPERLTVIKDLTTDLGILPPGGEAVATETHRKSETMTTVPRGGLVTPTRETLSFGKHPLAAEWKTETPGEETITPVGHQAVTPGGVTVAPMHLQTGEKIMPPRRKAEAPENMTIPSGKMTVTPAGQTETLEKRI
ncbi:hypothetical protein EI555_012005, partial [Monodon monoceros]